MSLLTQCPRCGFHYIRPLTGAPQTVTCSNCHCVFTMTPVEVEPPSAALAGESEPIHDVEHIEVLDGAAERLTPQTPSPPPESSMGSLELGPPQMKLRLDDVEIVESPPVSARAPAAAPMAAQAAAAVPVVEIVVPAASEVPLDPVEVIDEPAPSPNPPDPVVLAAEVVDADVIGPAQPQPPPVPLRRKERPLDIRKRVPDKDATVSWGVWLGLGIPLAAVVLLVVVILAVMAGGRQSSNLQPQPPPPAVQPAAAPAAAPVEQFLPSPVDWPTPPDRRGPAPWLPNAPALANKPRAADELQGLLGYWPLDEGQNAQVADKSNHGHASTLVGGWWIDGVRGKALLFDGRRDYLELGSAPVLNFGDNASFTVAGWMATRQHNGYLLAFRNPKNFAAAIQVKVSGGALCGVVRADGSEFGEARVGLAHVADGRWHHFALVRHPGGVIECFLDGQSLDKRHGPNTIGPITTLVRSVGCERSWYLSQRTAAAYFACAVDELCVFNRALTTQEVGQLAGR